MVQVASVTLKARHQRFHAAQKAARRNVERAPIVTEGTVGYHFAGINSAQVLPLRRQHHNAPKTRSSHIAVAVGFQPVGHFLEARAAELAHIKKHAAFA